jgi:2-keto-3-deoxy-galactonokinase
MKKHTKIISLFILIFISGLLIGASIFSHKENDRIPNQMTLVVDSIRNDHDVILRDQKNNIYVMSVENAYDDVFSTGTIIFFGKNDVIIK